MSKRSKIRAEYYKESFGQYWKTMNTTAQPTIEYVKWLEDRIIRQANEIKNEDSNCNIGGVICCGVLEKMNLGWMETKDGRKCMPYITKHDATMYRVNYCPSCGKYVRDVIV